MSSSIAASPAHNVDEPGSAVEICTEENDLVNDEILNEQACIKFLDNFLKLLQWYNAHKAESKEILSQNVVSQIVCYTNRLMQVFDNPSSLIQLQAARLLQLKAMPVVRLVLKLSSDELKRSRAHTEGEPTCALCFFLLECFMLNCLSQKPIVEINGGIEQQLLSLLFKHLEEIPTENPQDLVKLTIINSVLNVIYWKSKWNSSFFCVPSEKCITSIETVATTYPIQMVKILAKSVLCVLWPYLDQKPYQKIKLDDIEIQSFMNFLLSREWLYQAILLPICSFMEDLVSVSPDNKYSFLKWNAYELLVTVKKNSENFAVSNTFDKLISLLMSSNEISSLANEEYQGELTDLQLMDHESIEGQDFGFIPLTKATLGLFDFLDCVVAHFINNVEASLLTSNNLTLSIVNSITPIWGLIRHVATKDNIFDFIGKKSKFFSAINDLLNKWPEIPDSFPLFGNAFYGILMSGSNHLNFCIELGRSGLLYSLLSYLSAFGIDGDIIKFGDVGNVIGILIIVFNCALNSELIPALELVSSVNILPVFARCSLVRVAVLAKFVLSFLEFALENSNVLLLTDQEIQYVSSQLSEALDNGSSSHWYTDLELLKVLINLTQGPRFTKNIVQIISKKSIPSTAAQFLQSKKLDVQKASLRFLLNLYAFLDQPSIGRIHGESSSAVEETLSSFAKAEDLELQQLATCAHMLVNTKLKEEPDQILQCIELCCKFGLHDISIDLCSVKSLPQKCFLYLFKGKSLFHLYRREQHYLRRHSSICAKRELEQKRENCYKKAEDCIKLLGAAFDHESIDSEGSKMLDIVMLDYMREINKLNNLKRCLLCRKKRNLMRSHIWPRSFLRSYSKSRKRDISSRIFISFHSHKPREKSPGEVTYWMLCGECEQRISQNGEDKFVSELYDKISLADDDGINIPYGPWLYNFSVGLVFRTFLYHSLDSLESYSIFQECREHLLKLPVKYKSQATLKDGPNTSLGLNSKTSSLNHQVSSTSANFSSKAGLSSPIIILVNPTKLNIDHPRKSMLIGALNDAGSAVMTTRDLVDGKLDLIGQHHFIAVHLGNVSILFLLKASSNYCPPPGSLIHPKGGDLFIPDEDSRWGLIPEGLWFFIETTAEMIEETSLYHYEYKSRVGHWISHLPEEQEVPVLSEELADQEKSLHKRLKEASSSTESSLFSKFLKRSYPTISFLPDDIKLFQKHNYTKKGYLQLPSSHFIFLHQHINLDEDGFTIFLVGEFRDDSSTLRIYVIFIEQIRGVQLAYSASVNIDNSKVSVANSLVDMKQYANHHAARFEYYRQITEELLPLLLKANGCDNIHVLTGRAEATRLSPWLMSLGSLDSKCKNGCWYCERNCHHCLQQASAGYSLRKTDGTALKFCKTNICYTLYSQDPEAIPAIIVPLPFSSFDSELVFQVCKVISTNWSKNTVVIIQLCVTRKPQNIHDFDVGQLYVLVQFRTHYGQAFFDFSISKDFFPVNALKYMQHKTSSMKYHSALLRCMLKLIIEDALAQTSYKTLQELLDAPQPAMQDQDCKLKTSSEESGLPEADICPHFFEEADQL